MSSFTLYTMGIFYFAKTIAFCSASIMACDAKDADFRAAKSANFTFFMLLAIMVLSAAVPFNFNTASSLTTVYKLPAVVLIFAVALWFKNN